MQQTQREPRELWRELMKVKVQLDNLQTQTKELQSSVQHLNKDNTRLKAALTNYFSFDGAGIPELMTEAELTHAYSKILNHAQDPVLPEIDINNQLGKNSMDIMI